MKVDSQVSLWNTPLTVGKFSIRHTRLWAELCQCLLSQSIQCVTAFHRCRAFPRMHGAVEKLSLQFAILGIKDEGPI